ncbi:Ribosomal RNA small subunit methyltransferase B [bacterium HR18]|jgi:16S rRNA (cytosine967-C5)-methyltransferase|uniref:16S rRNA (cytosine(967)-C(5))-methyltransferase n=1 Tax=Rhodothermus marinus TaxID=29549 RepID=A0A7V2B0L0_RHOMR|nr:Ribosomal RNA small subunit methyltransferase B [bacterium HR18]
MPKLRPFSKQPDPARREAVQLLERIESDQAYVNRLISEHLTDELPPEAGRRTTEYVAGVTRWRRWLDFLLAQAYHGRYDQLEPRLRQILRLGLYELLFLKTPAYAALHEAVLLAQAMVRPQAGKVVNAVLRTLLRQQDFLPQPQTGDVAEDLAICYSHPTWMVQRWLVRYGREATEALMQHNNTRPWFGIRVRTDRIARSVVLHRLADRRVEAEPSPVLDDFVRVRRLQPILEDRLIEKGLLAVQDESAGLVVRLLDPHPEETIIDACAAPGGKTTYIATRMRDHGRVLAFDVHPGRTERIRQAALQQGLTSIVAETLDVRHVAERYPTLQADRVLLDVPCSGLGVLAKRADLRWHRCPEALDELTQLQDALLEAAARLVRPGGVLVYSTCTIEPEENEMRVQAFLQRHPEFALEGAENWVPASMVTPAGFLATWPPRDRMDGAFAARMRRKA